MALNPATPLMALEEILGEIDFVLVKSVELGFGGQEFIPQSLDKIARLRRMLSERNLDRVLIAVDGGIHAETIGLVVKAGADIVVAGSALFNEHASVADNLHDLRAAIDQSTGRKERG